MTMEEQSDAAKLYKTELCRSWEETGSCRYGAKCQFAHGKDDLRPVNRHPKYKTEVCRTFSAAGTCPYGKRCRFIHSHDNAAGSGASASAFVPQELGILRRQSCNPQQARSRLAVFREICL